MFSKREKKEINNDSYRTNRALRKKTIKDRVVFLFKLLGEVEDQKTNGVYDDVDDNGNDKTTTEEFNDVTMITRTAMNVVDYDYDYNCDIVGNDNEVKNDFIRGKLLHGKMEIVFITIMVMKMITIYIHTINNNNSNTNTAVTIPV